MPSRIQGVIGDIRPRTKPSPARLWAYGWRSESMGPHGPVLRLAQVEENMGASGLGSLLVKEGFLTEQDRLTITKTCGQGSWAFAKSILAIGLLDEDELAAFFAERTRYQIAPKDFLSYLDPSAVQALDKRIVSKLEVIPLKKDPGKITVGVVDPLDRGTLKQLEFFTGLEVNPVVIPLSQLYEGLVRIDPDFRLHATALTHFLKNHAQAAWVRQKLETAGDPMPSHSQSRSRDDGSGVEEIYDDIPEIEELDDDELSELDAEIVEEEEDDLEAAIEIEEEVEEDDALSTFEAESPQDPDPFAGTSQELADFDEKSLADTGNLDDMDDILEKVDEEGMDDEGATLLTIENPKEGAFDFDASLDELDSASKADEEKFEMDLEGDTAFESVEENAAEIEGLETDVEKVPVSTFGFEETKPRMKPKAAPEDILDSLSDQGPSLDLEALKDEPLDTDLFADLHSEEADDEIPISQYGIATDIPPVSHHDKPFAAKPKAAPAPITKKPQLDFGGDDEEETQINLRPAVPLEADDDDIELHPRAAKAKESASSGINPTSALNEIMVRLSLCFGRESAFKVLQDNLNTIGDAGCLVNTVSHRQILWNKGQIISEELGPAALHPLLKGLDSLKWKNMDLKASESWTQNALRIRAFRDGDWLWAHSVRMVDDTLILRETVESLVSQVSNKIGAG